jgi:carboxylesterase type B
MNYRLGGFGFLAGKELQNDASTNLGLRDQRLAMEWVHENIEKFGGDPLKVTIMVRFFNKVQINRGGKINELIG